MKTWTFVNKSEWPRGPWDDEPDKTQWVSPTTGYTCLTHRGRSGAWCGYVGVPPGHRLHGVDYSKIDDQVDIHGGLTYSAKCTGVAPTGEGICHEPEEGEDDDLWWFGFDCAHCFDIMPALLWVVEEIRQKHPVPDYEDPSEYRTLDYVRDEVGRLAMQLAILDI